VTRAFWLALFAVVAVRLWIASALDPLADEVLYAAWAESPAWGYFDQPPGVVAGVALGTALLGDDPLGLRVAGIAASAAAAALLARQTRAPSTTLGFLVATPALFGLTLLAVPDALRISTWAAGLAAALAGRWGWVGAATAACGLCRHDGLLLLPLAALALRPSRGELLGAVSVALTFLLPHLAWLAAHDAVTVRFQLAEVFARPGAPGPLWVLLDQAAVGTPLGLAALALAAVRGPGVDPVVRLGWWTSVPVFALFAAASFGAPPEAHWPASGWIGVGLAASTWTAAAARLRELATGLGALATGALCVAAIASPVPLPDDPAWRFREGRALADGVGPWVLPEGVAAREPAAASVRVDSERYQEAALLRWHLGVDARVRRGCGRPGQQDLDPAVAPATWFVRPRRGGPPTCVPVVRGHRVDAPEVRRSWDLFEVAP
jgi:hypothetical protein